MDKLVEFINSFKDINFKELAFRSLNLLPYLAGALILVIILRLLINLKSKRGACLGVSSLAFFKHKRFILRFLPEHIFVLATAVLILALLSPVLPITKNKQHVQSKDIMIVLDCSATMFSTGIYYTGQGEVASPYGMLKVSVAIKYIVKFLESRKDDGVGLIVYSDYAYLSSPLNFLDHQSLISLIKLSEVKASSTGVIIPGEGSTATGEALALANTYLEIDGKSRERAIVIFTDGESNCGVNPEDIFPKIKASGFKLFVLGIDYFNESSAQALAQFAKESGGGFFPIQSEDDFKTAVYSIDRMVGRNQTTVDEYKIDEPRYFYFAFVSLVLFVIAMCLKHLHYFRDLL